MAASDDYPGRQIKDSERSPFGLGWEHKRRGLKPDPPYMQYPAYMQGWGEFHCLDEKSNRAMLSRGVSIPEN